MEKGSTVLGLANLGKSDLRKGGERKKTRGPPTGSSSKFDGFTVRRDDDRVRETSRLPVGVALISFSFLTKSKFFSLFFCNPLELIVT